MYKDASFVLTESEIKAGLGAILGGYGKSDESTGSSIKDRGDVVFSLVSAIEDEWNSSDNRYNRDIVIFEYVKKNVQLFVDKYSREEKLDTGLVNLAKKNDCIQILVRNALVQLTGSKVYDELNYEIIDLEKTIHENEKKSIVYDLVNRVQKIIHENCNSPMALDKAAMKMILSCARLHINLWQLKTLSLEEYLEVQIGNHLAMKKEFIKPSKEYILDKTKFYKYHRYFNMRPLQKYTTETTDSVLRKIYDVSLGLPKDDYLASIKSIASIR